MAAGVTVPGRNFRLRRTAAMTAALVALLLLEASTPSAFAQGLPGGAEVSFGQRSVSLFLPYPDMAACQDAYHTNCYGFSDGTVVGQFSPLSALTPFFNLLGVPWGGCDTVPQLGASSEVVEVYAGAGVPLVVGPGDCDDLLNRLGSGGAYLAVPGVPKWIPPTTATVMELNVAGRQGAAGLR